MKDLRIGFIDVETILSYVTEEEVFELVFGELPEELEYVTSPFREDSHPSCWFEVNPDNGELRFCDFANYQTIKGVRMNNIGCFDAVMVHFNIRNFYETLKYVKARLITGRNLYRMTIQEKIKLKPRNRREVIIKPVKREFEQRDARYWKQFGISSQNLQKDKVYAVRFYKMYNTKSGDFTSRLDTLTYCFNDFGGDRVKLYSPLRNKYKFVTNCTANDIGGISQVSMLDTYLVISKSYKDFRVLKNMGINTVWFQNEGMVPDDDILIPLVRRFARVYVFFDNDKPGILASDKVSTLINKIYPYKSKPLHLPLRVLEKYSVTDPADMYKKMGKSHLLKFLKREIWNS